MSTFEPISKKRLSAHGCVAPLKRDFTSIFMNIKEFIGSAQNAHILSCMLRFFAEPRLLSTLIY
jgi:hypothetical protein